MTDKDRQMLIETHTIVKAQSEQIGKLFTTIEGNGHPGIKQRLALIEQAHDTCKKSRDKRPDRITAVVAIAVAAVAPILTIVIQSALQ